MLELFSVGGLRRKLTALSSAYRWCTHVVCVYAEWTCWLAGCVDVPLNRESQQVSQGGLSVSLPAAVCESCSCHIHTRAVSYQDERFGGSVALSWF